MAPKRHWRQRIADMLEHVELIEELTRGASFQDFQRDQAKILAVERCLEIIGEASRHVPDAIKARIPDVPWRDLREIRNVVAHVYFAVSLKIIWKTVQHDLPIIAPRRREFLEEVGAGGARD